LRIAGLSFLKKHWSQQNCSAVRIEIRNPQSAIRNPSSAVRNPKSAARSPAGVG